MKKLHFAIIPVFLVGCAGSAPTPAGPGQAPSQAVFAEHDRVREKVDATTGMRVYSVVPDVAESREGKLSMASVLTAPPEGRAGAAINGEIGFQTTSKAVQYRECDNLVLVLDGKALPRKSTQYFGSLGRGYVVEAVVAPVSPDDLARIVAAKNVEYRLCNTRGALSTRDRGLLGRMLARYQDRDE